MWLLWSAMAVGAVDLKSVPSVFCEPFQAVNERVDSCEENSKFDLAAKKCITDLEKVEAELGQTAMAVAKAAGQSQAEKTNSGKREYAFSEEALKYIVQVATLAKKQMAEYRDYLSPPPFALDPETERDDLVGEARKKPCFGANEKKILESEAYLTKKIALYQERLGQSKAHQLVLQKRETDYGSITANKLPVAKAKVGETVPVPVNTAPRASDISGIKKTNPGKP